MPGPLDFLICLFFACIPVLSLHVWCDFWLCKDKDFFFLLPRMNKSKKNVFNLKILLWFWVIPALLLPEYSSTRMWACPKWLSSYFFSHSNYFFLHTMVSLVVVVNRIYSRMQGKKRLHVNKHKYRVILYYFSKLNNFSSTYLKIYCIVWGCSLALECLFWYVLKPYVPNLILPLYFTKNRQIKSFRFRHNLYLAIAN